MRQVRWGRGRAQKGVEFGIAAAKGAICIAELAVCLKTYPDTNREPFPQPVWAPPFQTPAKI
jgi:hypothetical protein